MFHANGNEVHGLKMTYLISSIFIVLLVYVSPASYLQQHQPMMSEPPSKPDSVLSTQEVVTHLMKHCTDILLSERQNTHDTIKSERDHTTLKISKVFENFDFVAKNLLSRIEKLEAAQATYTDSNHVEVLMKKILHLEQRLLSTNNNISIAVDTLEEAIANVNLQASTSLFYCQNPTQLNSTQNNSKATSVGVRHSSHVYPTHPPTPPTPPRTFQPLLDQLES